MGLTLLEILWRYVAENIAHTLKGGFADITLWIRQCYLQSILNMFNIGTGLLGNQKLRNSQKAFLTNLVFIVLEILSQGLSNSLTVFSNGVPHDITGLHHEITR